MMSDREQIRSLNPATEELVASFQPSSAEEVEQVLAAAREAARAWRKVSFDERAARLESVARYLEDRRQQLAELITAEMGKPIVEAEGEIDKCAWACTYFARHGAEFLSDQARASSGTESYVSFLPLGPILAIMPWNFPFWQVIRFAAPALMAGNTAILKHAPNVPRCALGIEEMFRASGLPPGVVQNLFLSGPQTSELLADDRIAAVTLTGSDRAGASVGAAAGRAVKKAVLELGGSDAFIVLEDADLELAAATAVRARFQNTGQSCIAAKRFIVVDEAYDEFRRRFVDQVRALRVGNPLARSTTIGPLAREDLRDNLVRQLEQSRRQGARVLLGGERPPGRGYFFSPAVLEEVVPEMTVFREEVFGPIAPLIRARDSEQAIELANLSAFGLGCNIWTNDLARARALARDIEAGSVFINGMVASDPRLPFGGVKRSGYGRELSEFGIREFVNLQTVWIGPKVES